MIKTTSAYKEAAKENGIFHHEARIEFQDGSTITVDDMDIFSLQISEASSNTSSFDLGAANADQLTLKLNNIDGKFDTHDFSEALITVKIGLELPDRSTEWLNKGSFNAEPGEESGNTIAVKAFDDMVKFDQPYSLSKLAYPATLGNIVRDACSCCGVTLAPDTASFDNDNYVVQNRPDDSSVTFRQVLQWVGQIACKFFVINIDGKLSARWYNTEILESMWGYKEDGGLYNINGELIEDSSGLIIVEETEGIIKTDALLSGSVIKTDDVVITGIKVVEEDQGDTSAETTYQSGAEGYVLEISGNKLIQDGNGATIASYLGERLNGLQFRPMEVDVPTDPAREAGDLGLITDARGRHYKTIFTNIEYTAHAAQKLTSGAEAPTRLSSVRYSQATRVYKELRANLKKQKTEWDAAFDKLQSEMKTKNGLFPIRETQEDGSSILYFCDKPELSDASIVVKFSAAGWAMSTDGGKTWNSGWLVDGTMIAYILNAIGINAKWINTGALTIKDSDGKIIFEVDVDKKSVYMNPDVLKIGDVALSEKIKNMDNSIAAAKNMTMILSNEYQAVAADANGKIEGTFPVIQTKVMVMYGSSDISADCSYTITKSAAVAGKWDETARTYTVTELNADDGWIDIKAVYLQNLSITKRFTVSKVRSGTNGKDGTPGRTYILEPSCNVLKRGSDKVISPNFITFKAYYRDGDSAARVPYKGRFIVEETVDGSAWKTIYISSTDEDTVTHYLYSILTNSSGQAVASSNGSTIGIPRDVTNVRCKLYASGGTTTLMDMQSVAVVIDVDNLTQEQIVSILTNDGALKGLYYSNGRLYVSLDALLGGSVTLGGKKNGNGYLKIKDASNAVKGLIDRSGYTVLTNYEENSEYMKYTGVQFSSDGMFPVDIKKFFDNEVDIEISGDENWRISWDDNSLNIYATEVSADAGTFENLTVTNPASFTKSPRIEDMEYTTSSNTVCWDGRTGYKQLMLKSSSSKRYKDIGSDISEQEIEEWYNIEPLWAKYKEGYLVEWDENEGRYIPMFIAEDVEKYFPEATRHANGLVEDWNERIMIPAMFAMLKAQKKKIDQQEKLINKLCKKLNI
nr:MAG TPA: Receptor recognition protein, Long tail, Helical sandwich, Tail fiber [Caudoviricetes sp.]